MTPTFCNNTAGLLLSYFNDKCHDGKHLLIARVKYMSTYKMVQKAEKFFFAHSLNKPTKYFKTSRFQKIHIEM